MLVDVAEVVVDVDEGALDVGDGLDALLQIESEVVPVCKSTSELGRRGQT